MNLELLRRSIKHHEGLRLKPYMDTADKLTIGYGRNLTDNGINEAEACVMLDDDIQTAIGELDHGFKGWRNHNDIRQNVLVELCFNIGSTKLKGFEKMWKALKAQDYELASFHIMASAYAIQVGKRARTLANLMRDGK